MVLVDMRTAVPHIAGLTKQDRKSKASGDAAVRQTGQFLGRSRDGTLIVRPDFRPKNFTVRQLRKAVRDAKRREAEAS